MLGLSTRTLFFSRMGAATVPPYYTAGRLRTAVAAATKPLRALFWKGMEVRPRGGGAAAWKSTWAGSGLGRTWKGEQRVEGLGTRLPFLPAALLASRAQSVHHTRAV